MYKVVIIFIFTSYIFVSICMSIEGFVNLDPIDILYLVNFCFWCWGADSSSITAL